MKRKDKVLGNRFVTKSFVYIITLHHSYNKILLIKNNK